MSRVVVLMVVAGCGRIAFDPHVIGHDEDGDRIGDGDDVCPHVADADQADRDGDGVGDTCDPNPTVARDSIALFATMMPGDVPFVIGVNDGAWTQLADSWQFTGTAQPDDYLNTYVYVPLAAGDLRVALGIDVLARIEPGNQHQIALLIWSQPPAYFVELNELSDMLISQAAVTYFDGTSYMSMDPQPLAAGIHTGAVTVQATQRVGIGVRLDASWPGEAYTSEIADSLYQGASNVGLNFNNLHVEVRYLCVIASS